MASLQHSDAAGTQIRAPGIAVVRTGRMRHRAFFPGMSVLLLALVFIGFAPTYYLRPANVVPIPWYIHVHGAAMTAWFVLLLLQSLLVATGHRSIHRRTGMAGVVIAIVIALLNPLVLVWFPPRGIASGLPIDLVALIFVGELVAMVVFATLVGLAIARRRDPEAHSRLLVLASVAVVGSALGRLSMNTTGAPLAGELIQISLALLVVVHDRIVAGRIHPVSIWGSAAIIGNLLFSTGVANTQAAHSLVRLMSR